VALSNHKVRTKGMNKSNFPKQHLEGQCIIQIRFNRYCIDFVFSNDIVLQISCKLSYYDKQGRLLSHWNDHNDMNFFMNQLLEVPVDLIQSDVNALKIVFDNQESLLLESNHDGDEAFTIFMKDEVRDFF